MTFRDAARRLFHFGLLFFFGSFFLVSAFDAWAQRDAQWDLSLDRMWPFAGMLIFGILIWFFFPFADDEEAAGTEIHAFTIFSVGLCLLSLGFIGSGGLAIAVTRGQADLVVDGWLAWPLFGSIGVYLVGEVVLWVHSKRRARAKKSLRRGDG